MSCGNSNWTVRNISNARFFFSGPDGIEKHIVTKVKLLIIGIEPKYPLFQHSIIRFLEYL